MKKRVHGRISGTVRSWLAFKSFGIVLTFATGVFCGLLMRNQAAEADSDLSPVRETTLIREGGYKFVNPLLECELARHTLLNRELKPFKDRIQAVVDQKLREPGIKHVSVYFRDLNNGPWFGINEKFHFSPASLLKVPLMIACFKMAENSPHLLERRLVFHGNPEQIPGTIKGTEPLAPGEAYSIEELVRRMIVYSDNDAVDLLLQNLDPIYLEKQYKDLGIHIAPKAGESDFMSVKNYASFFRILFNASYLNRSMSEKALEFLSEVEFKEGLVAGVPKEVMVSHKFGERLFADEELKQLHDCGIVYHSDRPYLLCIMTRGTDFKRQSSIITEISREVYEEVHRQSSVANASGRH